MPEVHCPDQFDRVARNPRIIRKRQKLLSVEANWPAQELIALFTLPK